MPVPNYFSITSFEIWVEIWEYENSSDCAQILASLYLHVPCFCDIVSGFPMFMFIYCEL